MAAKSEQSLIVGRRLRELREHRGIPKELVALRLGMSAENVRHYESGRNQLAVTMLPTLANVYGMTLAELVAELFSLPDGEDTVGQLHESRSHDDPSTELLIKSRLELSSAPMAVRSPIRELALARR